MNTQVFLAFVSILHYDRIHKLEFIVLLGCFAGAGAHKASPRGEAGICEERAND